MEEWRVVDGFENYEVSNLGRVRHRKTKRVRKPQDNGKGYKIIQVVKDGKHTNFYVHIAVGKAFIPNDDPEHKTQISHLDETRDNNRADNLTWATPSENCNMEKHIERQKESSRKKAVRCIETGEVFVSTREAARQMGMANNSHICKAANHKEHYLTAGGYHWEYV